MNSIVTLGSVASFSKGSGLPKSSLRPDGRFGCIHYGELFTKYDAVIKCPTSRTSADLPVRSINGDVLMPTSDVTPRGLAKASALLADGVILGGDILIVRPDHSRVDSRYLAYALRGDVNQVLSLVRGSTVYHLYASDLYHFEIDLPTKEEQIRAANALQAADDLIATLERLIAKKQAIKQGMMQQLLTGRTRLPGFTDDWVNSTIRSVARVTGGGTPSTRIASYWGGDVPWFTPAEIWSVGAGLVSRSVRTITQHGLANSAATLVPAGTVLVTSRASIGNCAVTAVPVTTNQGFASMIPNDDRSTWFLYYWVQQNQSELVSRAAGSTFLEISASKVASIPLRQPGLEEQAAIGAAIRVADLELEILAHRLKKVQAMKTGMMQQLLTGRTRLPMEVES